MYIYTYSTCNFNLVARVLNYVKWVEFSRSQCWSSVPSGNQSLKMNYKN